jgi:hypothetical protein
MLTAFVLLPSGWAFARPPVREPLPTPDDFVVSDCGFDVLIHVTANKEKAITFFDQDGDVVRQEVTGVLKVRLTHVGTETSVDLNISGPGSFTFPPDGSIHLVGQGNWLNFGIANRPGIILFSSGRFEATTTPTGDFLITRPAKNETDVCGMLS